MRYTTVIDISDYRQVYKSANCRLVYLHLALKAGYHDDDRDIVDVSIRNLAMRVGISVSAARHALAMLEKSGLLTRSGGVMIVKKWCEQKPVSKRQSTQQPTDRQAAMAEERRRIQERQEEKQRRDEQERREFASRGKSSFMVYYEAQIEKARQGDPDAAEIVKKRRAMYEQEVERMKQEKQ